MVWYDPTAAAQQFPANDAGIIDDAVTDAGGGLTILEKMERARTNMLHVVEHQPHVFSTVAKCSSAYTITNTLATPPGMSHTVQAGGDGVYLLVAHFNIARSVAASGSWRYEVAFLTGLTTTYMGRGSISLRNTSQGDDPAHQHGVTIFGVSSAVAEGDVLAAQIKWIDDPSSKGVPQVQANVSRLLVTFLGWTP